MQKNKVSFYKYNRNMPDDFLQSKQDEIQENIRRINDEISTQEHLDKVYLDFVLLVKD